MTKTGRSRSDALIEESVVPEIMHLRKTEGLGAKQIIERLGLKGVSVAVVGAVLYGKTHNQITGLPKYAPKRRRDEETEGVEYREIEPGYRIGDDGLPWTCVNGRWGPRPDLGWRKMKPHLRRDGGLEVTIGKRKHRQVHHLVLEAFVGPCPPGMEACHFPDRDRTNNRLENLQWNTSVVNKSHMVIHGTAYTVGGAKGEDHPRARLTEPIVREIMRLRNEEGLGPDRIVARMGIDWLTKSTVENVIYGSAWNHITGLPLSPHEARKRNAG